MKLRAPEEILATLDDRGCLDGVPFMPEMLSFFDSTFTVLARVERACDTVNYSGVLRLRDTVLLDDLRCNGGAHGGCGAQCRLYWKEAWLRVAGEADAATALSTRTPDGADAFEQLALLVSANVSVAGSPNEEPIFRCQATELLRAGQPVGWWSLQSLFGELFNGNVRPWRFVRVATRILLEGFGHRLGRELTLPFHREEMTSELATSPSADGLQTGQLVQIKRADDIRRTLNAHGKTRGLWFDREMKVYCGQSARVRSKVERFIDEGTGRMIELATDAYILDDVYCKSDRSNGRWFCPRAIYPWWRECWLEPVDAAVSDSATLSNSETVKKS